MKLPHILAGLLFLSLLHAEPTTDWEIYTPDKLPPGKTLTLGQTAGLASQTLNEFIYLVGRFTVTASGKNRIVLRDDLLRNIRLVVEYPPDQIPPAEGSTVTRTPDNPYLVVRVQSTRNGQINILARECLQLEQ